VVLEAPEVLQGRASIVLRVQRLDLRHFTHRLSALLCMAGALAPTLALLAFGASRTLTPSTLVCAPRVVFLRVARVGRQNVVQVLGSFVRVDNPLEAFLDGLRDEARVVDVSVADDHEIDVRPSDTSRKAIAVVDAVVFLMKSAVEDEPRDLAPFEVL